MAKVWSGHLNFGLVSIPVALHTGARDESVSLNQLHSVCKSRTKKPDWCPVCERAISRDEIVKAYDKGAGQYVEITKAELESITPASEKVMEIRECVDWAEFDPVYLAESFYVTPDAVGKRAYTLLAAALRTSEKVAIAQLTKNNREHIVLIRPVGDALMMHFLYYPEEINTVAEFYELAHKEHQVPASDLKLARQLVENLSSKWEPSQYENGYNMRLTQLIASKLDKSIAAPTAITTAVSAIPDLTAALAASLAKPARKPEPVTAKPKSKKRAA